MINMKRSVDGIQPQMTKKMSRCIKREVQSVVARLLYLTIYLLAGCTTTKTFIFPSAKTPVADFYRNILSMRPDLENLAEIGPFKVQEVRDFTIRINTKEELYSDVFFAQHNDKAPLVIIQHGNLGSKEYHREQAIRLASWGSHVLTLKQVNERKWAHNGYNLAKLVILLQRWPDLLDSKFDPEKIILAGHSFGGSAIGIAAGTGISVRGLIFLDPAVYNTQVGTFLSKIRAPSFILAADRRVFSSRHRATFFGRIPRNVAEISIKGATHNDAQYPNQFSWSQTFGIDHRPDMSKQNLFAAAMVSLVMSYTISNSWDQAWPILKADMDKGNLFEPKKKAAVPVQDE